MLYWTFDWRMTADWINIFLFSKKNNFHEYFKILIANYSSKYSTTVLENLLNVIITIT